MKMKSAAVGAVEHVVAGLVASWVVGSFVGQYAGQAHSRLYVKLAPRLPLLPRWTFFAPHPGNTDARLVQRRHLDDGTVTDWEPIFTPQERSWGQMIFFASRRREKAVSDISQSIITAVRGGPSEIEQSYEYTMLRRLVKDDILRHHLEADRTRGVQFALMRDSGFDEDGPMGVVFVSKYELFEAETGRPDYSLS